MKVRAKISFMAFEKRMTITELFCQTIFIRYNQLMESGEIPKINPE
jgi:hypothetical protein